MASWISSKLKAAETILQQIDQQAAESLRKDNKTQSHDQLVESPRKTEGAVSLKDQLKKKTFESNDYGSGSKRNFPEQIVGNKYSSDGKVFSGRDQVKERISASETLTQKKPTKLTEADWTELLNTPNRATSTSGIRKNHEVTPIRGLKKDNRRQRASRSDHSGLSMKKNQKSINDATNLKERLNKQFNTKPTDDGESSSSGRSSGVEQQAVLEPMNGQELEHKDKNPKLCVNPQIESTEDSVKTVDSTPSFMENLTTSVNKSLPLVKPLEEGTRDLPGPLRNVVSHSSISHDAKKKGSSSSDNESDSDSESSSSTDSERERERQERRMKVFAEKVAAKAVEAIKEQENGVARLEGEKQSLEKILEERAKQQAKEASELQTNMMETMEAVELEKEKHNNTRMEVLTRLAGLETANVDLARSLAAAQKKLEAEIDRVAKLREQIELKESAHEELERRILYVNEPGASLKQLTKSKGVEFEHQMLEAECSLVTDRIVRLQEKAMKLEADTEMLRKEMEEPTEVEVELKRRLDQLTDHLIQKQSQVEVLSSEKSTLLFRIEAVTRLLEENDVMSITDASSRDLETGQLDISESKLRPMLEDKIRSGKKHLGSLVRQLNAIFVSGAVFLRRNPTAKVWSVVYIICLHLWVLYILVSHSDSPTSERKSGAVISLENINNTAGSGA